MRIEPELGGVSIVFRGAFNPTIFQPYWLFSNALVSEQAARNAEFGIVHPGITQFAMESLFSLTVTDERFTIERNTAPWILVSDISYRIFTELLPHTPVNTMGINRMVHFNVPSQAVRDRIGLQLAPREPWAEWGRAVSSGEGLKHGGVQSLTLVERNVSDRPQGWRQARIEPSIRIGNGRTGVYMEVNDHYELPGRPTGAGEIMAILNEKFDSSVASAEKIIDQIMSLAQ